MNSTSTPPPRQHTVAVVVGASMAGLFAARALHEHVDRVVLLERERLRPEAVPRGRVPQGQHAHVLLAAGQQRVAAWFPGVLDDLAAQGAVHIDGHGAVWHQAGGYRVRGDWGQSAICMTRPVLETTVRRHVLGLPRVSIRDGAAVRRLMLRDGRVTGVLLEDGEELAANLVVDCGGRNSRLVHQLRDDGLLQPPESRVHIDMAYGSRLLRRRPGDLDGSFVVVAPSPPESFRAGVLLPVEGDRWILSLGGMHGDAPPVDNEGYLAFARSLPSPAIAQVLERAEPLTPVVAFRLPSNQRRHFEQVSPLLTGLAVLGDAVCSFNPIYGQGMSSAALQAEALEETVDRHGLGTPEMTRAFAGRAAKVIDNPWAVAAGADFAHPSTTGAKPPGTDLVNRYVHRVLLATHTSLPVQRAMNDVQNLLAPPSSLMRPSVMARVALHARRSPDHAGPQRESPTWPGVMADVLLDGRSRQRAGHR